MAQAGAAGHNAGRYTSKYAKYKVNETRKKFNRVMLGVTGGLIVIMLFVHISQLARISAMAKQISAVRREIVQLEESRQYLKVNLAARQDMDRVKDEATGRLGMIEPTEDRVRQISLSEFLR